MGTCVNGDAVEVANAPADPGRECTYVGASTDNGRGVAGVAMFQRPARSALRSVLRRRTLKRTPRKADVAVVTLRQTGSWRAYAVLLVMLGVVAAGIAVPTHTSVVMTPVAQLVNEVNLAELTTAPVAVDSAPASEPTPPPPEPTPAPAPAPEPAPEPDPCAAALDGVAAGGLPLPAGVDYQCPSTRFAHQGAACWDEWPCPGTAFIAINMSRLDGASPEYLRHVVAHEICHIIDFRDRGWSTEPRAEACAAEYGF